VAQLSSLALFDVQIFLPFADPLQPELIRLFVALRAGSPDRWAFLGVQHAELQAGHVGCLAHFAAKSVDLASQMPFREAAHCRVAGHRPNLVYVNREEERLASHPGGCKRSFDAGMPGAKDNHIILLRVNKHTDCRSSLKIESNQSIITPGFVQLGAEKSGLQKGESSSGEEFHRKFGGTKATL
jgi:hypothetical protein